MKSIDEIYQPFPDERRERGELAKRIRGQGPPRLSVWKVVWGMLVIALLFTGAMVYGTFANTEHLQYSYRRTTGYTNARYAMDMLENDLLGTVPFDASPPGVDLQEFWMENGRTCTPGQPPRFNTSGNDHVGTAADRISFRALTSVADTMQKVQVTWELVPSNFFIDSAGNLQTLDAPLHCRIRTPRAIYSLVRRVRAANPGDPTKYTEMAKDSLGVNVPDSEMCHYVLSFNLEYMGEGQIWSQLEPSPFTSRRVPSPNDPLGNGQGPNDLDPNGGALRVPAVRATIVIVEDTGERQDRVFTKVFWIPVG